MGATARPSCADLIRSTNTSGWRLGHAHHGRVLQQTAGGPRTQASRPTWCAGSRPPRRAAPIAGGHPAAAAACVRRRTAAPPLPLKPFACAPVAAACRRRRAQPRQRGRLPGQGRCSGRGGGGGRGAPLGAVHLLAPPAGAALLCRGAAGPRLPPHIRPARGRAGGGGGGRVLPWGWELSSSGVRRAPPPLRRRPVAPRHRRCQHPPAFFPPSSRARTPR